MTITQEMLIQSIAQELGRDEAVIHKVFKSMERIIFDSLAAATPSEPIIIKLFNGFHIEGTYVPGTTFSKGMFRDTPCSSRIKIKPSVSRYYSRKLNTYLEDKGNLL